jgi:hypothetical protein
MRETDQDYPISRAFFTDKNWFPPLRRMPTIDIAFVLQHRHTILSDSTSTG